MKKHRIRPILFVEGSANTSNGNLRLGINKLLAQVLRGKMPKIIMGEGRSQTVRKFKNSHEDFNLLLIDSDCREDELPVTCQQLQIEYDQNTFFMIQEMEAWFISQKPILEKYYNKQVVTAIKKLGAPKSITKPSKELRKYTTNHKKREYEKVKHATDLLLRLNASQLMKDFPEFKRLVERIREICK